MLLSNDRSHYSNFGYFAAQNALLVDSLIHGRSLRDTVEKLTVTKTSAERYEDYIGRVYRRPQAPGTRTNVVLVVYDQDASGQVAAGGPQTVY